MPKVTPCRPGTAMNATPKRRPEKRFLTDLLYLGEPSMARSMCATMREGTDATHRSVRRPRPTRRVWTGGLARLLETIRQWFWWFSVAKYYQKWSLQEKAVRQLISPRFWILMLSKRRLGLSDQILKNGLAENRVTSKFQNALGCNHFPIE